MKLSYEKPMIYSEEFITKEYVAACNTELKVPNHIHFENRVGQRHCAFTSSGCGSVSTFDGWKHQIITTGQGKQENIPRNDYSNCHVLDNQKDAEWFATKYFDASCKQGVADALHLQSFEEIKGLFS